MQNEKSFIELIKTAKSSTNKCSVEHINKMIVNDKLDGLLIDVRSESEYSLCSIPGSININVDIIDLKIESIVPNKKTNIYLYCKSDIRSAIAAFTIKEMGYNNATFIEGGILSWIKSDYFVETPKKQAIK